MLSYIIMSFVSEMRLSYGKIFSCFEILFSHPPWRSDDSTVALNIDFIVKLPTGEKLHLTYVSCVCDKKHFYTS